MRTFVQMSSTSCSHNSYCDGFMMVSFNSHFLSAIYCPVPGSEVNALMFVYLWRAQKFLLQQKRSERGYQMTNDFKFNIQVHINICVHAVAQYNNVNVMACRTWAILWSFNVRSACDSSSPNVFASFLSLEITVACNAMLALGVNLVFEPSYTLIMYDV